MGRICFSNKSRKNNRQRCFEGSTGRCFHMCRRCQVLLVTRNNTVTEQSKVPAGRFSTVAGRSVCSGTEGGLLFDGSFAFDIFAWESLSCCSFLQRAWRWDICMITVRMYSRRFITQNQNVPQRALKTESKVECAVQNIESFLYVQLWLPEYFWVQIIWELWLSHCIYMPKQLYNQISAVFYQCLPST